MPSPSLEKTAGASPAARYTRLQTALALLAVCCLAWPAPLRAEEPPEPLPLKRVVLPPGRIPEEMKRLGQGELKQLSRDEFEELVRRAARAASAARKQPRLVEARYRARLENGDLVGTAQWQIANPGTAPALLALAPFNLALRQPRLDNKPAVIGDLEGQGPELLLEQAGDQSLAFDWSARGERRPEGQVFALEVPACPLAALELDVPADQAVSVASDGCLLSGPQAVESLDRRRWKVEFTGRSQVRLLVNKADGPGGGAALVLATQTTRQRLTPDAVEAVFRFDLKVLHQAIRELRLECDPALRPYQVLAGAPSEDAPHPVETWDLQPGTGGAPAVLTARLAEPFQGGTLEVRALAPLAGGVGASRWHAPWMVLTGAAPRGETLELRLHPDVHLRDWQPGGFRLLQARTEDGWQVLRLTGGALARAPGAGRPGAHIEARGAEFRARELLWWKVVPPFAGAGGAADRQPSLAAQVGYDVARGHLFQLPLELPPGWQVDHVQLNPAELLRGFSTNVENGRTVLMVDLQHPLGIADWRLQIADSPSLQSAISNLQSPVRLTVWLRPSGLRPAPAPGGVSYPFPDVVPLGATWREGGLAVEWDEGLYEAEIQTEAPAGTPNGEGPWGKQPPGRFYPYRGRPVQGSLVLRPRHPRLRAHCTSAVGLTADRVAVMTRLVLQPEVGTPEAIDLVLSAPLRGRWEWRTEGGGNAVQSFEPLRAFDAPPLLAPLAASRPLGAAALLAAVARPAAGPRPRHWRLTLTRPLRAPLALEATYEMPRNGGGAQGAAVEVPLLTVPAANMEGEVKLYLSGASLVQVEAQGLQELAAPAGGSGKAPPPWRVFRYGAGLPSLTLRGRGPAVSLSPGPAVEAARLTTYAGPDGQRLYHYRFQVWNWQQPTLPIRLPAGARLLAARVDGRWIGEPGRPSAEEPADGGTPPVELPAPAGGARHAYELLYALRQPRWYLWADVDTAEPALPLDLKAPACVHTWFLAPGVVPLGGAATRLPGFPEAPGTFNGWLGQVTAAWQGWGPPRWLGLPAPAARGPAWQGEQRQRLADAALAVGKAGAGGPATLGAALESLALDGLQGPDVLVLDATALREAGLGPGTPLPASDGGPFWESAGLVYLPCPPGPLLTTRQQAEAWQAAGLGASRSAALAPAVAEAILAGHDRSGRFRRVEDWLRSSSPATAGTGHLPQAPLLPGPLGPGWSAWEPMAGASGPLRVVRQGALPLAGGVVAVLLALVFWRLASPGWRLALLVAWLAGALLALLWLPTALDALAWWPLLAGLALALPWYLRWIFRPARARVEPGSRRGGSSGRAVPRSGAVATGLLVALSAACALLPARAASPAPAVVFLLPGPADAPDRQTVLAPPQLLDQLEALTRRGHFVPHGAVLTAADYQATISAGAAQFTATLAAHAFEDGPTNLSIPLAGVELEELLVDGARAAPQTAPGPAGGYVVALTGKGDHSLLLRFQVPVQTAGADCELHLTAPRLVESRLTLQVPAGARYLQALTRQGAATLDPSGTRLQVDLGQVEAPLRFHWRQDAAGPQAPRVTVEELYLWEFSPAASSLSAVLQYGVAGGPLDGVAVELPPQLDVRGVEVAAYGGEEAKPRLKDWYLLGPPAADQPHRLQVEFRGPVTAGVQVLLDLVPRRPLGARARLPLPTPLGAETTAGYLAYRLDGLREVEKSFLRVKPVEPEEFLRRWKQAPASQPAGLAYAGQLGRRPAAPLELTLAVQPVRCDATQDLAWHVGPEGADLRATLRLTAPDGDLALVEWEVPESVAVPHVTGPEVVRWGRSGSRLQIWLAHSAATAEVQLSGWWLPPGAPGNGKQGHSPLPYTLDLPHLWLPAARAQTTAVHLTAANGLTMTRLQVQHLDAAPNAGPPVPELSFLSRQHQYGGRFLVRPAAAGAEVRLLTRAELRDRQLAFVARVECRSRLGDLGPLTLRLRNWDGDKVRLQDAPEVAQVQEHSEDPSDRSWTVALRPGTAGPVRLTLTGSLPLDEAVGGVPMPDVSVDGAPRPESWLAVAGSDLIAADARGLTPVSDSGTLARDWPDEAARVRGGPVALWRVAAPAGAWDLRLRPRQRAAAAAAVRVFLSEQTAAVADGRHWTHQASYWLYHEASTDLRVTLPEGAVILGASVDGAAITLLQPEAGSGTLWLPLPRGTGARAVSLRWAYAADGEALDRPRLEAPRLEGVVEEGPVLWKVEVPTGYLLESAAGPARPAGSAGQDLRRAEAQLRLAETLARQAQAPGDALAVQLAAARRRFAAYCRFAERRLTTPTPPTLGAGALLPDGDANRAALRAATAGDRGPDGQDLAEWLRQLREREQQLAQVAAGLEAPARGEAESPSAPGTPAGAEAGAPDPDLVPDALSERGTPLCWQAAGPDTAPPVVQLVTVPARQAQRAAADSLLLLALCLFVGLLSVSPVAVRGLRALWPEQLLLGGLVVWLAAGLPLLAVLLLLVGLFGRLFWLLGRLLGWLFRPARAAGPSGGATPA